MVKTPNMRHSKTTRDPVTIDLEPGEVKRHEDAKAAAGTDRAADAKTGAGATATGASDRDSSAASASATSGPASKPASPDAKTGPNAPEPKSSASASGPKIAAGDTAPKAAATAAGASSSASATDRPIPSAFGRSATGGGKGPERDDKPSAPAATAPAPKRRGSGLSALVAGLLGGVVALGGAWALQNAGVLPSPQAQAPADDGRVAALQQELQAVKDQIAGLPQGGNAAGVDELRQALGDSQARVDSLTATVDEIRDEVGTLRSAIEAAGNGDGNAAQALDSRIAAIEASVARLGENGSSASQEAIDQLTGRVGELANSVQAANTSASELSGRVAAVEQSVAGLTQKIEAQADQPRIALAIAASALKAAVDRGGAFASEVETFAAVAPDSPELEELRRIAAAGVPSRAELVAASEEATGAMIAAARPVDENAGFFDRLLSSAESLVEVRPIDAVQGDAVPAVATRIEAAVNAGDLAKAIAEFDTLPDAAKTAGAEFADKLRLRLQAEQLVDKALAGALKA